MQNDLTGNLLKAWREAERAADTARTLAGLANRAAEAATAAAEAARQAAADAGINLDKAGVAAGKARDAFHQREADVAAHQVDDRDASVFELPARTPKLR